MSGGFAFDHFIERGDDEIELRVCYSITTPRAATYWQPAEGGEVEIVSVEREGVEFPLTDAEDDALFEVCERRAMDDYRDALADEAEYRAELRRDDLLRVWWERGAQ